MRKQNEKKAKPRKSLKKRSFVWASEPWMSELLCALADAEGSENKKILKAFAKFENAAKEFVKTVRDAENKADFWETALNQWLNYHSGKPNCALAFIEKSRKRFPKPERARDFLLCPALSEDKITRLIDKLDSPRNQWEKYVSKHSSGNTQYAIMKAEKDGPKERFLFRLGVLRREAGFSDSRDVSREASNSTLLDGLSELDDLLTHGFRHPIWGRFDHVWSFIQNILPPNETDLKQDSRIDSKEKNRILTQKTEDYLRRIRLTAKLEPTEPGSAK